MFLARRCLLRCCLRSWTINTATVITLLGLVQTNIPLLQLSARAQGVALIVIGVVMVILRMKTTTSIRER